MASLKSTESEVVVCFLPTNHKLQTRSKPRLSGNPEVMFQRQWLTHSSAVGELEEVQHDHNLSPGAHKLVHSHSAMVWLTAMGELAQYT